MRLKDAAEINPEVLAESTDPETEIRYVDIGAVTQGSIGEPEVVRFADAPSRARRVVRAGDTLVATVRTYLKAIALVPPALDGSICSTGFAVLRPRSGIDPRYLTYWARSASTVHEIVARSVGVSYPAIGPDQIATLSFAATDTPTQRKTADFLDREIGRLDALAACERRLRQSLHDRASRIRDDLVQGSVDRVRLRHALTGIEQGWSPQCEARPAANDEWGVLRVGAVNRDFFDASENKALPSHLQPRKEYEIRQGDLLMSRANTRELVGSIVRVGQVRPRLLLCDKLYRLEIDNRRLLPSFLIAAVRASEVRRQLEAAATGASDSMQNISQEVVRDLLVPMPQTAAQQTISAQLKTNQRWLTRIANPIERQLSLLAEHREALITAAVTGQIDVTRDAPSPPEEALEPA